MIQLRTCARYSAIPLALALCACGGNDLSVELLLSPAEGNAPLWVDIDASGSADLRGGPITARFDFDSNGEFEVDWTAELSQRFLYEAAGDYIVTVEVMAEDGRVGEAQANLKVGPNTPPTAQVSASPGEGVAPLTITLDASGSADPDGGPLMYRFDFNGDGVWDSEWSETSSSQGVLQTAGSVLSKVQVKDLGGLTAEATLGSPIAVRSGADLDADTDRDGDIDDEDDAEEQTWARTRGALVLANLDDDDGDGRTDASVRGVAGSADGEDLTALLIRSHPGLGDGDTVRLEISPAAAVQRVQIYGEGLRALGVDAQGINIAPSSLSADQTLWIEALEARSGAWDGQVQLTLRITKANGETFEDTIALRVAPVVLTHHLLPAERLFVMQITDRRAVPNEPFFDDLSSNLPSGLELMNADQFRYAADRWLQDPLQAGYQEVPGAAGTSRIMHTYLKAQRPTEELGLEYYVEDVILSADVGFAYPGNSRDTSLNYGGNLEVAPPHSGPDGDYPLGRVIIGGGDLGLLNGRAWEDHMSQPQTEWLDAQGVQGPSIEISTEWLAVGHVDEIFLFMPNKNAAEGERAWKVAIASPDLAWRLLEEAAAAGAGSTRVFSGRDPQTTVSAILANSELSEVNDAAQTRIDTVRDILSQRLGLTDADFIEVPVLYETIQFGNLDLAAAYNPGIQNLVIANDRLFVPDPEGPMVNGVDPWAQWTQTELGALGFDVRFVDVFDSYHLQLGEAHCGTLTQRTPPPTTWWSAYEEAQP